MISRLRTTKRMPSRAAPTLMSRRSPGSGAERLRMSSSAPMITKKLAASIQ